MKQKEQLQQTHTKRLLLSSDPSTQFLIIKEFIVLLEIIYYFMLTLLALVLICL